MADVQYYLSEDKNQILVSGSSTKDGMNALLTSSKLPSPEFDPNLTAKISALGMNTTYVVQNGNDTTSIPIADNQELWVYRGYNQVGGDGPTYRYNPILHRPYKAYILTETGSGTPSSPYLPTGSAPNTGISSQTGAVIAGKYLYKQLSIVGNDNSVTELPRTDSGSFTVYDAAHNIHPFVFTKYTSLPTPPGLGSEYIVYRESSSFLETGLQFNTSTTPGNPGTDKVLFNNSTVASVTEIDIDKTGDNNVIFLNLSSSISNGKHGGKLRFIDDADSSNFCTFDIDAIDQGAVFPNPSTFYKLTVSNGEESSGFTLFGNNAPISASLFNYPQRQGQFSQQQSFIANPAPALNNSLNLPTGSFTYTSSTFLEQDSNGVPASGSTQFGLYADYGFYASYNAQNNAGLSAETTRIFFTGSNGVTDSKFFDLEVGRQATYTAMIGSISASSPNFSSTRNSVGEYLGVTFTNTIVDANASGTTPENIFATRWNDAYVSFSASLSSSLDGLYVFNQIPQNDVQVTASVLLAAWTGSDTGSKYGTDNFGTGEYGEGEAGEGPTWQTASIRIYTGSFPNSVPTTLDNFLTESIYESAFIHTESQGVPFTMSFSIPSESVAIKDCLSMALEVSSGSYNSASVENSLVIREYSLEFNTPTQSLVGDGKVPAFIENAFSGTLGFSNDDDCQPLYNNITGERENKNIQIIEYQPTASGYGGYTPLNFWPILSGSAQKSTVPESYYTLASQINPRYLGSRTEANTVNSIEGLANGFGNLPVIDYQRAYFAYCDQVIDPYPVINNKTQYNIKYLINDSGDALQPNLSPYTAFDVEQTWDEQGMGRVGINQISGSAQYDSLNGLQTFDKVAKEPVAVLWSQTASDGYASFVPLGGSPDVISNFTAEFTNFTTNYQGPAYSSSNANQKIVPQSNMLGPGMQDSSTALYQSRFTFGPRYGDAGGGGTEYQAVFGTGGNLVSGSQTLSLASGSTAGTARPGEFIFPPDPISPYSAGGALSDNYRIGVEARFPSTAFDQYRTSAGRSGIFGEKSQYNKGVIGELILKFQESSDGNTWASRKIKARSSAFLDLYYGNQVITINLNQVLGSRVGYTSFSRKGYKILIHWNDIRNAVDQQGRNLWDALFVEFRVNLRSDVTLKSDKRYRWTAYQYYYNETVDAPRNYWNPVNRPANVGGALTPSQAQNGPYFNVDIYGSRTTQNTQDGALNPPYWVYTGSAGAGTTIISESILQLSSSNGNSSYGNDYYQGYLAYSASTNPRFPGGIEPLDTDIPNYNIPWNLKVNDEIRFENNESQTYKIIDVIAPSQATDGFLTITLDGDVPPSVDKDFFLIRRFRYSPNTLISDNLFPYGGLKTVKREVTNQLMTGVSEFLDNDGTTGAQQASAYSSSISQTTSGSVKFISVIEPLTKKDNTPSGIVFPEFPTAQIELDPDKVITDLRDKKLIT